MAGGAFNDWERRVFTVMYLPHKFGTADILAVLEDTPPEVDAAWEPILRIHLAAHYGESDTLPFPPAFTHAVKSHSPRGGVYEQLLASLSVRHAGIDAEAFATHESFFNFVVSREDLHKEGEFLTYASVEITDGIDAEMDSSSLDEEFYISFAVAAVHVSDLAGDADYEAPVPPRVQAHPSPDSAD